MKSRFTVPGKNAWLYLTCIAAVTTCSAIYAGYFPLHRGFYLGAKDYFTAVVALGFAFKLGREGHLRSAAFWKPLVGLSGFVLLGGYGILQNLWLKGNVLSVVSSMRIWLYPLLLVWLGYAMAHRERSSFPQRRAAMTLALILIAAGSVGIYLLSLGHLLDWCHLYFVSKNICLEGPMPEQWIEPVHTGLVRMAGLFLDPVNNGHFWVWALSLVILQVRSFPRLTFWSLALGGLAILGLTYSKGAIFQFLVVLPWMLWLLFAPQFSKRQAHRVEQFLTAGVLSAPVILVLLIIQLAPYHPGLQNHWEAFQLVVTQGTWWGEGAGTHGQVAVLHDRLGNHHLDDSAWASLTGQFGWIGLILWGLSWIFFVARLYKRDQFVALLLFVQWGLSLFSEASMYPLSLLGLLIHAGYSLSVMSNHVNAYSPKPLSPNP
ncbi:MAG: hypothetical protein FJ338_05025 [Sphingomonadales bacterium]|nr:hypothetical protein [Sphingomonadales bacterium]